MLLNVYVVFDSKVCAYLNPFFVRTKGEAIRGFSSIVNDGKSQFYIYPEDYTLFEVGSYDDSSAKFILHPTPVSIGKAVEFVKGDRLSQVTLPV